LRERDASVTEPGPVGTKESCFNHQRSVTVPQDSSDTKHGDQPSHDMRMRYSNRVENCGDIIWTATELDVSVGSKAESDHQLERQKGAPPILRELLLKALKSPCNNTSSTASALVVAPANPLTPRKYAEIGPRRIRQHRDEL
jgi:hypothetical protein